MVVDFTPGSAALGGALLGVAASMLFALNGRILGISNIAGGALSAPPSERSWRWVFLAGLLAGGVTLRMIDRDAVLPAAVPSLLVAVVAGILVGVGTRLGSGCTSGHGLCGLARLSSRSLAATLVFMGTGALTVFVVRHVMHGGGAS